MKQAKRMAASGVLLFAVLLPSSRIASAQTVTAMATLDLKKYTGVWYELARYPVKPERHCLGDAVVLYTPGDKRNTFQMVTSCAIKNGNSDAWNARGKAGKAGDGRLKVSYTWPFAAKYWVLATGPEYEWALVGSPNHKSLWVLSRTPGLQPDVLTGIKARAAAEGYNTARLVDMPQHP